jgi:hypothetical protein
MSHSTSSLPETVEPIVEAVAVDAGQEALAPFVVEAVVARPAVVECEMVVMAIPVSRPRLPLLRRLWRGTGSVCEWLFGAVSLTGGLAFLAAVPVLQFLTLGYLLEASARIARTGRIREGFIGVRPAARIGGLVLGIWLMILPLRELSDLAGSAQVIDPGGRAAFRWGVALAAATVVMLVHILLASARGGKLRYFLWPFTNPLWLARRVGRGGYYAEARDAVWNFVRALRLPYYFWLGVRGFVGGFLWLALPVTLIAAGRKVPVLGFVGAALLILVVLHLPLLQVRFAVENRFRALFEFRTVRAAFRRAPWAWAVALFVALLFALPLYLLKIEMIPREVAWLPSLLFLVFIFPARLLAGWAMARSLRRQQPRHWFFRWTGRFVLLPVAAFYVLIVYFTQFTAWGGIWSLYEQHVFLLPVPFVGM